MNAFSDYTGTEYRLTAQHERLTDERIRMVREVQRRRESKRVTLNRRAERRMADVAKGRIPTA